MPGEALADMADGPMVLYIPVCEHGSRDGERMIGEVKFGMKADITIPFRRLLNDISFWAELLIT